MCSIVAAHSLHDVFGLMDSLQHRGRDEAGIAAVGNGRIDAVKWFGLVKDFSLTDLHKIFPGSKYHTFLGHVRYATRGKRRILQEAHPHIIGGTILDRGCHILIQDVDMAIVHNGQVDEMSLKDVNRDGLLTECDTEMLLHFYKRNGEYEMMRQIHGAFTLAIADKRRNEVIVMRDRTGIRPGVLGQKDGKYCVVSEDVALRKNGARYIEDLKPGRIYYLSQDGNYRSLSAINPNPQYCFFEYNYLAHVDSVLSGINVLGLRQTLGRILAEEHPLTNLKWLSFVPRCPEVAARAYASALDIRFANAFYKIKTERAFQGATARERAKSISRNLHLLPNSLDILKHGVGGIVDDSIIRGNNIRFTARLLAGAGITGCHLLSYTPPIGIIGEDGKPRGCEFGVDMPPNDNFIARGKTIKDISNKIKMKTHYISAPGMLRGFERLGLSKENLCYYCIGGKHPFEF